MLRQRTNTPNRRGGFTLLEVLLSSAIGVMLLGGLYVAVDVQLRQMHLGRRSGEQATLASRLLAKIAQELSGQLSPVLSTSITNAGSGSSSSGAAGAATGTATNAVTFNNGILGDQQTLIITTSRVPQETLKPEVLNQGIQIVGTSDVRRVMYWMAQGEAGLARFELKTVTDPNQLAYFALPPAVPDEPLYIVAPEVKTIQFKYFDGTTWLDTWDGSTASQLANSDGVTAQGPPLAIAVVIGIQTEEADAQSNSAANTNLGGNPNLKMYRRVIAIPTANGLTITPAVSTTGQ
jgi:prepilin-type N-terminal cleavage/methylation domain-containing protein